MMNIVKRKNLFVFLCVAPATLLFFIFMLYPTFSVFRMSFFERGAYSNKESYVAFENFKVLLTDERFITASQNTIFLIVAVTVITMTLSLIFAFFLTRDRVFGSNFFRVVFYIPNILSVVVISGVFSAIYDADNGLLNNFLSAFGRKITVLWKGEDTVIYSLVIALVWQAVGYYMVMYMASMSAVPKSMYESASLDGASRLNEFFNITLPLIWNNLRTTLTFFIISTINMAFLFVKAMTSGGPNGASEVVLSFMYNQKDDGLYGYSMAAGVLIFVFSFLLSYAVNRVTKRRILQF